MKRADLIRKLEEAGCAHIRHGMTGIVEYLHPTKSRYPPVPKLSRCLGRATAELID
jgi:hypothetical protein